MTKKERDIQKALGLISWYHVMIKGGYYQRNIQAVSRDDALQRFRRIILIEYTETEARMVLQSDSLVVRELPCEVK